MIKNGGAGGELTIDQLSAATGMSVRNIRAYQSRRLLSPPEVRGRVGYYGSQHLARIELVERLKADGFNLSAIAALVERGDAFVAGVEQLRRDLRDEGFDAWIPMSEEEQRLCEQNSPGSIERFKQIGTIRLAADGELLTDPRISEAGWMLNLLGLPPETIIDLLYSTHRLIRKIGDVYLSSLRERSALAMEQAAAAGDVQGMREVFEQTTPPAVQLMTTLFEIVLRKEAAASFERAVRSLEPSL